MNNKNNLLNKTSEKNEKYNPDYVVSKPLLWRFLALKINYIEDLANGN